VYVLVVNPHRVSAIGPSSAIAQAAISVVRSSLSCANLSIVLILSDFCWDYGRGVDQTPRPSCTIATISLFVDRLESVPIVILVQAIIVTVDTRDLSCGLAASLGGGLPWRLAAPSGLILSTDYNRAITVIILS
jgi:hypothetical protein